CAISYGYYFDFW
nr:immunoglobulin heavy chain junction region [Mus musculus]MBK4189293.1 immunoglobulin heavy chain junction region [Mus musculus]